MSTTAPDTPHQSPSCGNGSDVKALKKRVEQLVGENDELRRDKRSFRDASDESRRTLARMRDDIKELRRKLELERSEKEKALGEVKELQVRFPVRSGMGSVLIAVAAPVE
jgi:chromosome segregation ATPase